LHKSSLGGCRKKPIGVLNSPWIEKGIFFKIGEVWKFVKKDENEYKTNLGAFKSA
jgi:hypothetical protein